MASHGIKDRVAIVGMGCTPFAEHWDKGVDDLALDASNEAFAAAGQRMPGRHDEDQAVAPVRPHREQQGALQHALQCAQLAEWAQADDSLVVAALLPVDWRDATRRPIQQPASYSRPAIAPPRSSQRSSRRSGGSKSATAWERT